MKTISFIFFYPVLDDVGSIPTQDILVYKVNEKEGWDSIDYPINLSYREQWENWEAIREVVQNALDAGNKKNIELKKEDGDLIVSDTGEGMSVRHLILGVSEKDRGDRGQFGEGLKIALVVLKRLGYDVTIKSDNLEIKTDTTDIADEKCLQLHYKEYDDIVFDGTKVVIHAYDGELYRDRFVGIGNNSEVIESTPYGDLLEDGGVYVKDIYVDDYDTKFGYNLDDLEIGEDRSIANEWSLKRNIRNVWGEIDNKELWSELFEVIKDGKYYEGKMDWRSATLSRSSKNVVREAFGDVFDTPSGKKAVLSTTESDSREAKWRGAKTVNNHRLSGLSDVLTTDDEYVKEHSDTNDVFVQDAKLDDEQRESLEKIRELRDMYYERHHYGDVPEIKAYNFENDDTSGKWCGDELRVDVSVLKYKEKSIGTLIHEIAHDIDDVDDNTKRQVKSIQSIASKMILMMDE